MFEQNSVKRRLIASARNINRDQSSQSADLDQNFLQLIISCMIKDRLYDFKQFCQFLLFYLDKSKIFSLGIKSNLTLYSIDTHFDASTTDRFWKPKWEKEKLLVMSNFSFSHSFLFYQIIVSPFVHIFDIISLYAAEFKEP